MHIFRVGWLAGDCWELTSMGKSGKDSTKHQWSWVMWLEVFQVWQPGWCTQISIPKDPFWMVKSYTVCLVKLVFLSWSILVFLVQDILYTQILPTNWQSILRILRSVFVCLSLHGKMILYWAPHYFKLLIGLERYS